MGGGQVSHPLNPTLEPRWRTSVPPIKIIYFVSSNQTQLKILKTVLNTTFAGVTGDFQGQTLGISVAPQHCSPQQEFMGILGEAEGSGQGPALVVLQPCAMLQVEQVLILRHLLNMNLIPIWLDTVFAIFQAPHGQQLPGLVNGEREVFLENTYLLMSENLRSLRHRLVTNVHSHRLAPSKVLQLNFISFFPPQELSHNMFQQIRVQV